MIFSIDGIEYNVVVKSIKRNAQILDTENTGRTLNADMFRDVIGTFYNYSIEIDTELLSQAEYDKLYEVISEPTAYHNFVMPYAQEFYSYKGYVTSASDALEHMRKDLNMWSNLSFNIIAISPKRRAT